MDGPATQVDVQAGLHQYQVPVHHRGQRLDTRNHGGKLVCMN